MTGYIHIARFGNRGGAHTLLDHTGGGTELLGRVVWHTDVPPQGDASILQPFVAGYTLGDVYVVQRTRPDDDSPRAGMVATTAALVPADAVTVVALEPLFSFLADPAADLSAPPPFERFTGAGEPHVHPECAGPLVQPLSRRRRVACTCEDFAACIACLWRHLSPRDRRRLVFGAAFHPDALPVPQRDDSLVLVAVPPRFAPRFATWPVVDGSNTGDADPMRDAVLGDGAGAAEALAGVLLGDDVRLEQWRYLISAADLLSRLDQLDHEALRSLVQLLGLLAPEHDRGIDLKQLAMDRIAALTPPARFAEVRGLRGLPWHALSGAITRGSLMRAWVTDVVQDPQRASDFAAALAEVVEGSGDSLRTDLDAALSAAATHDVARLAPHLPAVVAHERGAHLLAWLARGVPRAALDITLSTAAVTAPPWLAAFCAKHALPRAHAAFVDVADAAPAWRAHVKVKYRSSDSDSILADRTGPGATVAAALAFFDPALTDRAGAIAAEWPELLAGDIADQPFRGVWAAAIRHGMPDPWCVVHPTTAATVLLDDLVADRPVDPAVLDALARTAAANISRYPQRAGVWDRLPEDARARMLTATAHAIGRRLMHGDKHPEPVLEATILRPAILGSIARDDPAQAVRLVHRLRAATAQEIVVVADRARFDAATAAALGDLVRTRRWKRAAESIVDMAAAGRADLRPAADRVSGMFSIVERVRRFVGISESLRVVATRDELRDGLHELVCTLFPGGPTDTAIWERAGGHPADLPDASTPRQRWGLALQAIDAGNAGAPSLADLLHAMRDDYPNNRELSAVATALLEE